MYGGECIDKGRGHCRPKQHRNSKSRRSAEEGGKLFYRMVDADIPRSFGVSRQDVVGVAFLKWENGRYTADDRSKIEWLEGVMTQLLGWYNPDESSTEKLQHRESFVLIDWSEPFELGNSSSPCHWKQSWQNRNFAAPEGQTDVAREIRSCAVENCPRYGNTDPKVEHSHRIDLLNPDRSRHTGKYVCHTCWQFYRKRGYHRQLEPPVDY